MTRTLRLILGAAAVALASGGPSVAGPDEQAAVVAYCTTETNLQPAICTCLGGKAAELTEIQQQALAATLWDDQAALALLRPQMSVQDTVVVATFFVNQPAICAAP